MRQALRPPDAAKRQTIREYDVLRVILALLVVIGHSAYYRISTPYGGMDYSQSFANMCLSLKINRNIQNIIYSFHMPCFMALSGALFFRSLNRPGSKYHQLGALVSEKAKRLLIPFLCVSLLYSFPMKLISGYYEGSRHILTDYVIGQLLLQGNTHLWYLVALFLVFIIVWLMERCGAGRLLWQIRFAVLLVLHWLSVHMPVQLIAYPLQYTLWFYAGYCFEPLRERVNERISAQKSALTILGFLIGYAVKRKLNDSAIGIFLVDPLVTLLGMCAIYSFAYMLSRTPITGSRAFQYGLRNSMGIYLYSDSWNYIILSLGFSLFGSSLFTDNLMASALYAFRILFTLIISILVSELLRRGKLKYLY